MRLVVDTNILVSFFRDNPVKSIISNSQQLNLKLYSPEHCWRELLNIKTSISKYSKLSSKQINSTFEKLKEFLTIVSDESSKSFEPKAKQLTHGKDIPIFALAIKLNCPIWSNEPEFKQQSKIPILSTRDMIELLF